MTTFDVIIIGAGPGGYVAALRASQLGMRVALVEKRDKPGGVCLNVGCIPSKALLHTAFKYSQACHDFKKFGIECDNVRINIETMQAHKNQVIAELTQGVNFLLKKNKVETFYGVARLRKNQNAGANSSVEVIVSKKEHEHILNARSIIVATGSDVAQIPTLPIDETQILSSTGALDLDHVPKTMLVVGGGYIGLELGSVWRRLGSTVTVVEALGDIAMSIDHDMRRGLRQSLEHLGMSFLLNTKVIQAEKNKNGVTLSVEGENKEQKKITAEVVLVSIGRKPATTELGLSDVGIQNDAHGFISVNKHFETSVPGIYAIGDVIGGMMLAHKAEEEAIACVENLAGQKGHVNYDVIPAVIFTQPEVASVGMTEEQAQKYTREKGTSLAIGKFPFSANSLSKATSSTEGLVKIIAEHESDRVLGVHIFGSHAGSMIAEAAMAMEFGASSEDIARTCHAHPTYSEALKEAAMDVHTRALHK